MVCSLVPPYNGYLTPKKLTSSKKKLTTGHYKCFRFSYKGDQVNVRSKISLSYKIALFGGFVKHTLNVITSRISCEDFNGQNSFAIFLLPLVVVYSGFFIPVLARPFFSGITY